MVPAVALLGAGTGQEKDGGGAAGGAWAIWRRLGGRDVVRGRLQRCGKDMCFGKDFPFRN